MISMQLIYKQANQILIIVCHCSLDMHSLQFNFRNNYKDRVICAFPNGQRKWEVRLAFTETQRFECKMLATMFDQRRETLKAHWVKRSKIVPKRPRNVNQKINHSKHHIWSLSFTFRFSARKSQSQQNLSKKITHFKIKFFPKNLTRFTNLNSLNSVKKNTPATQLKNLPILQIFHQPCFCLVSEKTFALLDF